MKRKTRILSIILPIACIIVLGLVSVLPVLKFKEKKREEKITDEIYYAELYAASEDTGASTAPASQKGGAIFLAPNTTYKMKGGKIQGKTKNYGGAVFISSGATFIMDGGTINACSAIYGGGIYVQAGATCIINGGSITSCTASKAGPAIYIEKGAEFTIDPKANVDENEIVDKNFVADVSDDTIEIGAKGSGLRLHYLYFGSYPQTFVGTTMNTTLENWFNSKNPTKIQEYSQKRRKNSTSTTEISTFTSYMYTDGNIYARGKSHFAPVANGAKSAPYKDGTPGTEQNDIAWFKVEPIRWVILNYDKWKAGTENIEILSEEVLTQGISIGGSGEIYWKDAWIREWLNSEFLNSAFNEEERAGIVVSHLKNNTKNGNNRDPNDSKYDSYYPSSYETDDQIYLMLYYDIFGDNSTYPLRGDPGGVLYNSNNLRCGSPTDYALIQGSAGDIDLEYETNNRVGTVMWWLRSAYTGSGSFMIEAVGCHGGSSGSSVNGDLGIRPATRLDM